MIKRRGYINFDGIGYFIIVVLIAALIISGIILAVMIYGIIGMMNNPL